MILDPAILRALGLPPDTKANVTDHGGSSFARTIRISTESSSYFLKTARGGTAGKMFVGEHASLSALHNAVPTICPASYGAGPMDSDDNHFFLVTEFLDLAGRHPGKDSGQSLTKKLAKLHTTPAPIPEGHKKPMFGFPVMTCCGDTPQPNEFEASWATFYAEHRLRAVATRAEQQHGEDAELRRLVVRTANEVVPRLLRDDHLGEQQGFIPVVVHGDLWAGNHGMGKLGGREQAEEVVFDPSCCYAHSEYDLGIMKMFGDFGAAFMEEYHALCPKSQPVAEYADRVELYEL